MNLSIVISAYNEEKVIQRCLSAITNLADEIIFIDNSSTDKTAQIAKKFTKKIFIVPNDPVMLNKNKNFGFSKASGEWILSLDADEVVTKELSQEIKKVITNKEINGYEISRKNIIFGKWIRHSIWWPDYNLRLFRNHKGMFELKHVHEKLKVQGVVGQLENPMTHYNYQTVSQYIRKMDNTYTESEVANFMQSGKSINWHDAIRFPSQDFLKTFFLQSGYKDGLHGLVLSLLQAFYAFIVFAKVWERKEDFKDITPDNFLTEVIKEFKNLVKDTKYWIYTALMIQNKSKKLIYKTLRKFR